ncbi:MAG: hypothetical protein HY343_06695 [Lentisphaerae bacterium]|nr:hypothetical protein [Lentisphaerota bacterium]
MFGDPEARVALELADGTDLHVILPVVGEAAAGALREKLLTTTDLYGTRIHVVAVDRLDALPFAQYVANAIVVAGLSPIAPSVVEGAKGEAVGLSGRDLGCLLHPCGGIMLAPGLPAADAEALCRQATNVEACALIALDGRAAVTRGPLPGARDWNANVQGDRRVAWPLRPLWYGGPDAEDAMHINGAHPPLAANGRYFVTGQDCLTAVDAYNGTTLWTRPIPSATPDMRRFGGLFYKVSNGIPSDYVAQWKATKRWLSADGSNVYLRLGRQYVGGTNDAMIQLDAHTGEQRRYFGPARAGPRIPLDTPQIWPLELDSAHSGSVALAQTEEGLSLTLVTRDPVVSAADTWDLHFDFRPEPRRYGLYGEGTFMVTVHPARDERTSPWVEWGPDAAHPALTASGRRAADGTTTTVFLAWAEIRRLTGESGRPASFGFAAVLNAWDGDEKQPVGQRYLFGDALAPALNNGWATMTLRGGRETAVALPAVVGGDWAQKPGTWPVAEPWADPFYLVAPGAVEAAVRAAPRLHPFTGESGPRVFRTGTGNCGNPVYAARMQLGRTAKTALGFYDFVEDGGLHFFPGVGVNCGVHTKAVNAAAALGLVLLSESRGHCDCTIPIRTSIAFAPAERRLNEDWAMFCERDADAPVRRLAANIGAFGDRRADDGTLWLSIPREKGGKAYPTEPGSRRFVIEAPPWSGTLQAPVTIGFPYEFRNSYYRFNADRAVVVNTPTPWVYASGVLGLTNLVVRLLDPPWVTAATSAVPPTPDGRLDDPAWAGATQAVLPFTRSDIRLRHDADAFYVAARRPAIVSIAGGIVPWVQKTAGEDADVWTDDAWEVFLGDARGERVMHVGVSASGARYDALAKGTNREDRAWNGLWKSAVAADTNGLAFELAIPWKTLTDAGLDRKTLTFNAQMCQRSLTNELLSPRLWYDKVLPEPSRLRGIPEPLLSLGPAGRERCANFTAVGFDAAPDLTPRRFTLRLHFADLVETNVPGSRVFDVLVQGKPALKAFDIVKEAGGPRRALVKEFKGVAAAATLTVEFVPIQAAAAEGAGKAKPKAPTREAAPLLCGLELEEEADGK